MILIGGEGSVSETELSSKVNTSGCVVERNWLQYSTHTIWKPKRKFPT